MFREFELVMWSCFATQEKIKEIIADLGEDQPEVGKKHLLNHLVNTAYYCKRQVTSEEEFEAYRAFFNKYF